MEFQRFIEIRQEICDKHEGVSTGKMMQSEAITYHGKVFAFFSGKNSMVFRLGRELPPVVEELGLNIFNPFKNRGPLNGWYESSYEQQIQWRSLALEALHRIKTEL